MVRIGRLLFQSINLLFKVHVLLGSLVRRGRYNFDLRSCTVQLVIKAGHLNALSARLIAGECDWLHAAFFDNLPHVFPDSLLGFVVAEALVPELPDLHSLSLQRLCFLLSLPSSQATLGLPGRHLACKLGKLLLTLPGKLFSVSVYLEGAFAVLMLDKPLAESRSCLVKHLSALLDIVDYSLVLFGHGQLLSLVIHVCHVVLRPVEADARLGLNVVLLEPLLLDVASALIFEC